jgi:hypothetical protein
MGPAPAREIGKNCPRLQVAELLSFDGELQPVIRVWTPRWMQRLFSSRWGVCMGMPVCPASHEGLLVKKDVHALGPRRSSRSNRSSCKPDIWRASPNHCPACGTEELQASGATPFGRRRDTVDAVGLGASHTSIDKDARRFHDVNLETMRRESTREPKA